MSDMTNLLLVGFAFGLSIVSYALVEDPIRRARWSTSDELDARLCVDRRRRGRRGRPFRFDRLEDVAHERGCPSGTGARYAGAARRVGRG